MKKELFDLNLAVSYYEPESSIRPRSAPVDKPDEECVVALCYQWFLKYGEDEWKEKVENHLESANFNAYNEKTH